MTLFVLNVAAADYGKPIDPENGFAQRLEAASRSTESITCEFEQTKYLAALVKPAISKGRFYYIKPQNICLEYSVPSGNAIVMTDTKFKIVQAGKSLVSDSRSNPMLRQLNTLLAACLTGDIAMFSAESEVAYYESQAHYTVVITPRNKRLSKYLRQIVLRFEKADMTLSTLRMDEAQSDYTLYEFKNKRLNTAIPTEKFTI